MYLKNKELMFEEWYKKEDKLKIDFFWHDDEVFVKIREIFFFCGYMKFFFFIYILLFFWFICVLLISLFPKIWVAINVKEISLFFSFFIFFINSWGFFNQIFWCGSDTSLIMLEISWLNFYNISYIIYIDFISHFFLFLTTMIIPICILSLWEQINVKIFFFIIILILLEFLLLGVFSVVDLILFYMYFESILIPMYLLLGIWGNRYRKMHAANLLFLYTFAGSIFFLIASLFLLNLFHSLNWFILLKLTNYLPEVLQFFFWICFFLSFSVKVPIFPFHIWLPEAHVEAPTVGSIILASILLKLGTYGILRFLLPFFLSANLYFQPFILLLSILGVIYASLSTLRQIDVKKIIAYSSISHMNLVVLGLFSFNFLALIGSSIMMISHGLISSGLFFSIGILYDRFHTKIIKYYGGLVFYMPIFSIFFLFLSFSNISFPLTFGFIGELLIFLGLFSISTSLSFLSGFSIILGAVYSIWLYNRIFFGQESKKIRFFSDINEREFFILFFFSFLIIFFGIFPSYFLESFEYSLLFYNLYVY